MTFVGAWGKETMLLFPVLGLRWLRTRAGFTAAVLAAAAFLVPTAILRTVVPGAAGDWAWWHGVSNVPFLQ